MQESSKSVVDHLRGMRNLLATPERWTQSVSARNARGDIELPTAPTAVCWCAVGASIRIHDELNTPSEIADLAIEYLDRASATAAGRGIVYFNDHANTTHADVLAVLDRATELAKTEEAT